MKVPIHIVIGKDMLRLLRSNIPKIRVVIGKHQIRRDFRETNMNGLWFAFATIAIGMVGKWLIKNDERPLQKDKWGQRNRKKVS